MVASFRLLIEILADQDPLFTEKLHGLVAEIASDPDLQLTITGHSQPTFRLTGEFPAGLPKEYSHTRFISYGFSYAGTGDPDLVAKQFARRLEDDELVKDQVRVAPDLPLRSATWAPTGTFDTNKVVLPLIGATGQPGGAQRVNVVVVDQGFDKKIFPANYAGGIDVDCRVAGAGHSPHAAMIARNILAVAPAAKLYDCPLIPSAPPGGRNVIDDIPGFTAVAAALCRCIAIPLVEISNTLGFGSWIFVNAWAVFDRRSDVGPRHYCDDPEHPLNQAVIDLDGVGADIIFAAGNCGQFDPDRRCDAGVVGPCRSILGANSLQNVLTVGAVRADFVPFGYPSQGPGQPKLALGSPKPDLCAPSEFADQSDRLAVSSGTSAATAVAAGIIAALRRRWNSNSVSPQTLRDIMIQTVQPLPPYGESRGIGAGLINLGAAAARLEQQFP